jgi:hypothetical protein
MTPTIGDTLFTKKSETDLRFEAEINALLLRMRNSDPSTTEYTTSMKALSKLIKLRDSSKNSRKISPDTLAIVVGNLLGVLVIVSYEKHNIVTSKALTFVQKLR